MWVWIEPNELQTMVDTLNTIHANTCVIIRLLQAVQTKEDELMSALDDLATSVAAEDTAIGSAVTLIQGFLAALAAAGTDPAKLAALKADVDAKTAALAASVVSGNTALTPPAPAPAPPPVVVPPITPPVALAAARKFIADQ